MTPEIEKYYDNYFDLFMTDGWKQFIKDLDSSAVGFDIRRIQDEGDLKFQQGQLKILDLIVNWEVSVRNAYDEIAADETPEE
jgi:hypothetical protein